MAKLLLLTLPLAIVIAIFGVPKIVNGEEKLRKGGNGIDSETASKGTSEGTCPPLWTRFQDHCYRFYGGPADWESADRKCRETYHCSGEFSAQLVSIHSSEENNLVYNLWQSSLVAGLNESAFEEFANRANSLWIGLQDRDSDGNFTWTDGTAGEYTYWAPNQPDNFDIDDSGIGEQFVHLWKNPDFNTVDKWNDAMSYYQFPFICKMPIE